MDCNLHRGHGDAEKQFRARLAVADARPNRTLRGYVSICEHERAHGEVWSSQMGEEQQSYAVVHSTVDSLLYESLQWIQSRLSGTWIDFCGRLHGFGRICGGAALPGLPVQSDAEGWQRQSCYHHLLRHLRARAYF